MPGRPTAPSVYPAPQGGPSRDEQRYEPLTRIRTYVSSFAYRKLMRNKQQITGVRRVLSRSRAADGGAVVEDRASVVIIGAGIVGCSAAEHLTDPGWRDVVVLDQGPLFEAGGATSPPPGGGLPTNPPKTNDK